MGGNFSPATCLRIAAGAVVFVVATIAMAAIAAEAENAQGVLVLRNGNVLAGGVAKLSGGYRVELAGASFRVPADQVEIACGSLAEAYEIRRSHRAGWSADSHVELASWCLRNNLPDQAAREILDVRTTDPRNPAISTLETQLKHALAETARRKGPKTQAENAPQYETAAPEVKDEDLPSIDVVEQAQFIRNIQPMLVHACATGGCHRPNGPEPMRLDRWALDGGGNATLIRRNLAEVLAQINPEQPQESSLLHKGRTAHGGGQMRRPSRPLDARQNAILEFWIDEVCGVEYEAPAVTVNADAATPTGTAETVDEFDPSLFNEAAN